MLIKPARNTPWRSRIALALTALLPVLTPTPVRAFDFATGSAPIDLIIPQVIPVVFSTVKPGVTPQADLTIGWATWTEFAQDCGQSRFWAGVHFPALITAGAAIGRQIGTLAHHFLMDHVDGTAPAP